MNLHERICRVVNKPLFKQMLESYGVTVEEFRDDICYRADHPILKTRFEDLPESYRCAIAACEVADSVTDPVDSDMVKDLFAKADLETKKAMAAFLSGRKVTVDEAIAQWAHWRAGHTAANTVHMQETTLRRFVNFMGEGALKWRVTRIEQHHLDDFVNASDAGKVSNREQRLAALRSFFELLTAKGYVDANPTKLVRIRFSQMSHEQKERQKRTPFTEREVKHILANTTGFWKWATAISYWAGLRLGDIARLEWATIGPNEIVVWTQKHDTRVALPLDDPLIGGGALHGIFLEMMSEHNFDVRFVFPEEAKIIDTPRLRSKLSVYYSRILTRLGIEGKSFHCLRHSFATRLDKAGKTIEQIGRALGHSKKSGEVDPDPIPANPSLFEEWEGSPPLPPVLDPLNWKELPGVDSWTTPDFNDDNWKPPGVTLSEQEFIDLNNLVEFWRERALKAEQKLED